MFAVEIVPGWQPDEWAGNRLLHASLGFSCFLQGMRTAERV